MAEHFMNNTVTDQEGKKAGRPDVNVGFVDASAFKDDRDLSGHIGPDGDPFDPKRPNYGTFFEAWPKVWHLRKYTMQTGEARLGMSAEDKQMAKKLIKEYQNG